VVAGRVSLFNGIRGNHRAAAASARGTGRAAERVIRWADETRVPKTARSRLPTRDSAARIGSDDDAQLLYSSDHGAVG
jgi:type III secretion system FlhB-like substrate exporter